MVEGFLEINDSDPISFVDGYYMQQLFNLGKSYTKEGFFELAENFSDDEFNLWLSRYFAIPQSHIFQYDHKSRTKRDSFFYEIRNFSQIQEWPESHALIVEKINIITVVEYLFDEIKTTIHESPIGQRTPSEQCWACLLCLEKQIEKIKKSARINLKNKLSDDRAFVVGGNFLYSDEGVRYSPDFLIEKLVKASTLCLKFLANNNNWFNEDSGVFPEAMMLNEDIVKESSGIQYLAISWGDLEKAAERCLFLGGEVFIGDKSSLSEDAIALGIKNTYHFELKYSFFDSSDFISTHRALDKNRQNIFETIAKYDIEESVVDDIGQIESIKDGRYLDVFEPLALQGLCEMYHEDFFASNLEFYGLTVREWVRGYYCLKYLSEKTKERFVFNKRELVNIFLSGGFSREKSLIFLSLVVFNKKSNDLYDTPLLLLKNGDYYLPSSVLSTCDIAFTLQSHLASLNVDFTKKGRLFESRVINLITEHGYSCKAFKFKRDGEEYEYDAVFIFENKVFVIECKSRSLSGWHPVRSTRLKKLVDENVEQVNRLVNGLQNHPEVFNEHFGCQLSLFEVIPIILNAPPFACAGKYQGVYITDYSSFSRFFYSRYITLDTYSSDDNHTVSSANLYEQWENETPTVNDFINHLDSPIQLRVYLNNIHVSRYWLHASKEAAFTVSELSVDVEKGTEKEFL